MKDVCIVIPIYKVSPTDTEYKAIENAISKMMNIDVIYVGPQGISLDKYPNENKGVESVNRRVALELFHPKYFQNVNGYSRLLLSEDFYERFDEYEYILIVQPDVWIIRNDFDINHYRKYDYIGAPWPDGLEAYRFSFKGVSVLTRISKSFCRPRKCYVGNGGFSLRKVEACKNLIKKYKIYAKLWRTGEDVFFSYFGLEKNNIFIVAPIGVAMELALEKDAREQIEKGNIPVGIHAWEKWYPDFLKKCMNKIGDMI